MLLLTARGAAVKIAHLDGIYKNDAVLIFGNSPTLKGSKRELLLSEYGDVPVATLGNAASSVKSNFWFGSHHPKCYDPAILDDQQVMKFAPANFMESVTYSGKPYSGHSNMFFYTLEKDVPLGEFLAPRQHIPDYNSTLLSAIHILYHLGFRRMYLAGCNLAKVNGKLYSYETNLTEYQQRMSEAAYEDTATKLKALKPVFVDYNLTLVDCTVNSRLGEVYEVSDLQSCLAKEVSKEVEAPELADLPHYTSFTQVSGPAGSKLPKGSIRTGVASSVISQDNVPMYEL